MGEMIGTRLEGRYEIRELIGEGGMADVYKAEDLLEQRPVAVKILREELSANEELVRRFKNESRAISVLNHPNIVKVYDVSVDEKMNYIVMEYIDGITLKEYIEQRGEPLTYKEVVHFTSQVLLALQHAHDKGIVHRDIKPQNIMLVADGTLKIMDFGIARLARSEIHTDRAQAIGSVHYISPEQAQGAETDNRADIYSLGIMMYEMLAGKLPFESGDAVSVAIQQISDEAVPLLKVNPSVPGGLAEITMRAMAKDPRNRYKSSLDMLRDIEDFKRDPSIKFEYDYILTDAPTRYIEKMVNNSKKPVPGPGKKPAQQKKKKYRRHSIVVPLVAVVTVLVVSICGARIWGLFKNSANPLFSDLEDVPLPNFVGKTMQEVEALLKDPMYSNIQLKDIHYEYNENVPVGTVISQNPTSANGEKMVKENQRLYLWVSSEPEIVKVPDVLGMSRAEATKAILDAGLRPYVRLVENDSVPFGQVFDTDPAVGAEVAATSKTLVTVYVRGKSAQDYQVQVPDIRGLSLDDARQLLSRNNLALGLQEEVYHDSEPGTIIEQSPEEGSKRMPLTPVNVKVSMGPEPPPPPPPPPPEPDPQVTVTDVVGLDVTLATSTLTGQGLAVSVQYAFHDTVALNAVISQTPANGTSVNVGSSITLLVSKGPDPGSSSVPDPGSSSSDSSSSSENTG